MLEKLLAIEELIERAEGRMRDVDSFIQSPPDWWIFDTPQYYINRSRTYALIIERLEGYYHRNLRKLQGL